MFSQIYSYTDNIVPFTVSEKAIFESAFTILQVPKKFKLAEEGKTAKEIFFINKGLVRLYYTKDGEEITGYIFKEGLFASSFDSFLRQAHGIQTLETLEDCELLSLSYSKLEELYTKLPKMNVLVRKVAEQRFINAQQILSSFILDSPEERYRNFELHHGDLLLRVPHNIIASFLGITPVSMSRIRKRMTERD
jgi:CRP/FNR family transcriptional regulator, anaerobic regulatory protein